MTTIQRIESEYALIKFIFQCFIQMKQQEEELNQYRGKYYKTIYIDDEMETIKTFNVILNSSIEERFVRVRATSQLNAMKNPDVLNVRSKMLKNKPGCVVSMQAFEMFLEEAPEVGASEA